MNDWLRTLALSCSLMLVFGCHSESQQAKTANSSSPRRPVANQKPTEPAQSSVGKPFDRDKGIAAAETLMHGGRYAEAATTLQRVLVGNPDDVEVLFRLGSAKAAQGSLHEAVALLDSIPEDHPEAGLPALGQAADWCMTLGRYEDAEARYKKVIAVQSDLAVAHRQLAFLYNRQGRRHEAADHIRTLCRLGDVRQDELHALMILTNAIFDDPDQSAGASHGRRYVPIGPAAQARILYTADRYQEAVDALEALVMSGRPAPSIMALYGRLAMEAQDKDRFLWWLARTDPSVQEFSDYWAALGIFLLAEHRYQEAVRSLAEALDRDPTDILSMRRISQALSALGNNQAADRWLQRYDVTREITLASNRISEAETPNPDFFRAVADGLEQIHRPLEAVTWRLFEAFHRQAPREEITQLNELRRELLHSENAFPSQSERLCGLVATAYPLADISIAPQPATARRQAEIATIDPPSFENVASTVGLDHTYRIASQGQRDRFAMYQTLGGGVAVFDYNLDGLLDIYLAQGGSDPPKMTGELSNVFYQQTSGQLVDVTNQTDTREHLYSIGVTTGDWNQDGFGDLVIANIGNKVLLINNGDGSFRRQAFDADPEYKILPSSVAMGDLTGDSLPDIFALDYVEDKTMLNRPEVDEQGMIVDFTPLAFHPGTDRISVNDGSGGLATKNVSKTKHTPSTGLGVVIADWDGKVGNEIFVGNDMRPNQLWARSQQDGPWVDIAALSGCSHGHGGLPTASMGIAVADFDGSGTLDIHVANYYLEPVSLFMNRGGMFEDRCVQYKLDRDSASVLGFGCQAIDYNHDGRPDLAVTNGNIERFPNQPLQQPPQLFVNLGPEFRLTDVNDPSEYWAGKYLGRSMARLDFNRDGKSDLLITHLDSPTALLLNETETENHWLQIQLVGTESERDAIGARVEVRAGENSWTNWLVGGDGYLCRNEAIVSFGLGPVTEIDAITVTWPNGGQQTFDPIAVDQRVLLIENQAEPYGIVF